MRIMRIMRGKPRSLRVAAVLGLAVALATPVVPAAASAARTSGAAAGRTAYGAAVSTGRYHALIRRTDYGVPHILAPNLGSAGFGQGWAYAEDRFCDLDDQIVMIRSQRSRYLGAGPGGLYLGQDLAMLDLGFMARARAQLPTLAPATRAILDGYAAGFDGYLAKTGVRHIQGWCAGQPWITAIRVVDLLAYERYIAVQDSGASILRALVTAQPPGSDQPALPMGSAAGQTGSALPGKLGQLAPEPGSLAGIGSNGWAIGASRSASGRGMVMANPHFPWVGAETFWESQLTVPGLLNVYGASLGGLPGIQIGFNDHVAWTHTVSLSSNQYTLYRLTLVKGSPTTYLVDGKREAMHSLPVTVQVKASNGAVHPFRYRLWSTRYGPVLNLSTVDPSLGWTTKQAITYRDADIDNGRLVAQWLGMDEARSLGQFKRVFQRVQGIPWLNTLAADDHGHVWYIDDSPVPNLSRAATAAWEKSPIGLLDGSNSASSWVDVPGARSPGLIPFRDQPQLERDDYVLNANNDYWLANPAHPLTGFSPLYGSVGIPQSTRMREAATVLAGRRRFTLAGLGAAVLSNRALTSDQLASGVVAACRAQGRRPVRVDGKSVDISQACGVLARWDRRFDVSSRGAVIWHEMIGAIQDPYPGALFSAGPLYRNGFNPAHPTTTPNTFTPNPRPVLRALAQAVLNMKAARIPLDAALGSVQHADKGRAAIPVPGSNSDDGILNVVGYTDSGRSLEPAPPQGAFIPGSDDLSTDGYVIDDGTSFLMTVEFTARGPEANALLTFSESEDPRSPHYADQDLLFTRRFLRPVLFTEREIMSDPALTVEAVSNT
jgi:acyl-homoserine-lactone acylase